LITLITGAPGAGKSAALVSLLKELAKGRAVYSHGIPDLKIDHQPLDEPNRWHETVPDGSIIVIDEVQNVWRPKGPGQGVPPDIQALEVHRHRGLDFYIVTQSPRLVHTNVRALVGRHVHLRDVGFLGRYWYEWPECAENCSASWKQAPLKKRYKLPKAIFGEYKSASVHVKPVRSFPVMLVVAIFALIATAALAWYVSGSIMKKTETSKPFLNAPGQPQAKATPTPAPTVEHVETPPPVGSVPSAYDPTIFIPQNPRVPESAPAYDHLRLVVAMPRVAGGICGANGCKCYTAQGNPLPMSSNDCREVIEANTFDPYRVEESRKIDPPPAAAPVASAAPALVPVAASAPAEPQPVAPPPVSKGARASAAAASAAVYYAPSPADTAPIYFPPSRQPAPTIGLSDVSRYFPRS